MSQPFEPLRALLSEAGYTFVEPPIVHDARIFVELAGEELRRRLFLTNGPDGSELALRPDYTIPVALAHLANGKANRRADYAYLGPVFRQRPGEGGEFLQAGVESLGRKDRAAADAEVLALALAAADTLGIRKPAVRIGDSALFATALDGLGIDGPWRRRFSRTFGDPERLRTLVAKSRNGSPAPPEADRKAARRHAEELLAASGLGTIGSRTADEIADRVMEKAALARGIGGRAAAALERVLAIEGPPAAALKAFRALAKREGLAMSKAIEAFEARIEAFAGRDVAPEQLAFAADFGRRLDYYTGFVFEIHDPRRRDRRQVVGGGRYDRLLSLIARTGGSAHGQSIPAVGFAIWLDRIGGKP